WDGRHLRSAAGAPVPNAAVWCAAPNGRCVLFGGLVQGGSDETWTWDGRNWEHMQPARRPPARFGAAATFDPVRNVTLLCGGTAWGGTILTDLWAWDGANWKQFAANGPMAAPGAFAFDTVRGRAVLCSNSSPMMEWDGAAWTTLPVSSAVPLPDPRL